MSCVIEPGGAVGILGGGQLGRMLAMAARRMGYRTVVFCPEAHCPATSVADAHWCAAYDDLDAVSRFARQVDVVTYEFENVPEQAAHTAARFAPLRPNPCVLQIAQHRGREKQFCTRVGVEIAPFQYVTQKDQLHDALSAIGLPAVIKTAENGYDGKGQWMITSTDDAAAFAEAWTGEAVTVEQWIDCQIELSVVAARSVGGEVALYGPIANTHHRHILDLSVCPAPVDRRVGDAAKDAARILAEALDVVGVICVEFFLTNDGRLLVNEIAPRPHNSGHLTIEGHVTSQFEQQLRAVCGLPLGDAAQRHRAAMVNLLGDLWTHGEPRWSALLNCPGAHLHLYGKDTPRPARKMGHLTVVGVDAAARACAARRQLTADAHHTHPATC